MKRILLGITVVFAALNGFAQGMILFNNFRPLVRTHIYAPRAGSPFLYQIGNGNADFPAGTTSWVGWTNIGFSGSSGQFGGSTTLAELLAAPGLNQPEALLQAATGGGITTFRTGAAAGGITVSTIATFGNIPADYAGGATVEMVVWDNSSGNYPTWATASVAWMSGLIAAGESGLLNITAMIGGTVTPPDLPTTLRSFNIYYEQIPEPCTFALASLGVAALLIARRRK